MRMAVSVDNQPILLLKNESVREYFKMVDSQHYDDYEQILSMEPGVGVLAAKGGRSEGCIMEEPHGEEVLKQQLWLREPVMGK